MVLEVTNYQDHIQIADNLTKITIVCNKNAHQRAHTSSAMPHSYLFFYALIFCKEKEEL